MITGASSGIGLEFAKSLAQSKANLVLTARSEQTITEMARMFQNEQNIKAHAFAADLSTQSGPHALFKKITDAEIDVDVVINNAGFGKWGAFESVDCATYESMCMLNINAVTVLTHLFLPQMLKKGSGGFLNVASTAGFQPVPYFATYSATKSFVLSFSEALAEEYRGRGITVTCLCPGGTESNFHNISKMDRRKLSSLHSADTVAKLGLQAFLSGKLTLIPGARNYLLVNSSRFSPRSVVAKVTAMMFKP